MLKTIVLDGSWQQIKIDRLWVDTTNMAGDITPADNANQISDSFGQLISGISIATDANNWDMVYIAERENADPEDCIALGVGGELQRPLTSVKALNELWVMWTSWDTVYVQAL